MINVDPVCFDSFAREELESLSDGDLKDLLSEALTNYTLCQRQRAQINDKRFKSLQATDGSMRKARVSETLRKAIVCCNPKGIKR